VKTKKTVETVGSISCISRSNTAATVGSDVLCTANLTIVTTCL